MRLIEQEGWRMTGDSGYDPGTDTVRVSRHDLWRLLRQFREELEGTPGRGWAHMRDYDVSFERLADAIDEANAQLGRSQSPDDRMRCSRGPAYTWPDHGPYNGEDVQTVTVQDESPDRGPRAATSHYAIRDGHGFWTALCRLQFTDAVSGAGREPACRECSREKRLAVLGP
jgi:hypothetical protein